MGVTGRNGCHSGKLYMDCSCDDYAFAFLQSSRDQDALAVRLAQGYFAADESPILIVNYEDIVDTLVLHYGAERYMNSFPDAGCLQEYVHIGSGHEIALVIEFEGYRDVEVPV